ncbi:peptide-N4-(N-acetyl-beta-glucosaminyl)asparagine amidase A [Hypoxylon trugodes]|uniref:peptide-N4-(N-acetyl-beta- glucosaminyl)asparagine amidase A n=1 Tax=Hypoxylon trugodes TaxID=326681 RepID=UPI0021919290|nr:peptide-N4-(N-acetyl-beta-glucosaminyl)asparagine amidase A [Hypoxylon trugodes]KAI1389383.1 peptide-N4-(N-acetyl-beta-glucosaminyl)asparagine amidase A [Hypoxylon trugodes]
MASRYLEKGVSNTAVRHHNYDHNGLSWREELPPITNESRMKFKLILTLLGLISFTWFTRLDFGQWLVAAPSLRQIIRSDLEQPQSSSTTTSATIFAPLQTRPVLECFQVASPVLGPDGPFPPPATGGGYDTTNNRAADEPCSVILMEHVFAFSYGMPFVGNYTPPSCQFNRVVMNFTVVSEGRQFDRLALMYFGDTEVWRTSTAEPTQPPGIRWTFLKDMTEYMYFWKSPQKLIFDLGNLMDDKYTGSFNATLTATFFVAEVETDAAPPADIIIPISTRKGATDGASQFTLPAEMATNTIGFPRNVNRAVFSISANGQASEEFWWGNVLESDVLTFNKTAGQLLGLSPFREVQLLIDGKLAGVQWPFPVIFTGGVVPSLHRPIVGLQAFDLREHQIDITPWLPLLCDGAEHTFAIKVAGLNDSGADTNVTLTETVNDSWYVTGKIFLWLGEGDLVTTGTGPEVNIVGPTISLSRQVTQNGTGSNETLVFDTIIERTVTIKSTINSGGQTGESIWTQNLSYSNHALLSNFGSSQINNLTIIGEDLATNPGTSYKTIYSYPLYCNQTYSRSAQGNISINAHLIEGLELQIEGQSIFPTGLEAFEESIAASKNSYIASQLKTHRDGTAFFFQTGDGRNSSGYGTTNQIFSFGGSRKGATLDLEDDFNELYFRNVTAVNGTIVFDSERKTGVEVYNFVQPPRLDGYADASLSLFALVSDKETQPKGFMGDDAHERPSAQVQIS